VVQQHEWWQHGVIYQVYPRSFADSNGDGVGDLPGIRARLDHLSWLGIDALWLSPISPSPMADFGYDVADYTGVDPLFGSLADLDGLSGDLRARGMRLLLDLVPNHSSDQHPWFVESRSSRENPRRDWYIWRDARPDGGPPNKWQAEFGGSAWEWDERTGQYYFHSFLKEQPDLDWTNPEVRAAMHEVMRFWFRRGVDGFRLDVVWLLAKGEEIEAGDHGGKGGGGGDQPEIHRYIAELRQVAEEFRALLIGELYVEPERLMAYYGQDGSGLQLPFNFQLIQLPWQADDLAREVARYEELLPEAGWPNWVLGNHDKSRIASRVGPAQARVAAMMLLTLRGTPTLYYGDELGMEDVEIPSDMEQDPQGLRGGESRDPQRTPMRWDGSSNGGFTRGTPWLPIGADIERVNAATQRDEPDSMLQLYRRLLELRRAEPALSVGDFHSLGHEGSVIAYERRRDDRAFLVALNLGPSPATMRTAGTGTVVLSTERQLEGRRVAEAVALEPHEGAVIALDQ
jgi:alpha-glucosidase